MEPKRTFIRLNDRLECGYKYMRGQQELKGRATIIDISGGGLKMVSQEAIKEGTLVEIEINFSQGPLEVGGEVKGSSLDWYISDQQKKTYWTSNLKFIKIPAEIRQQIIDYVHKRVAQRREARIKRDKEQQ